VDYCGFCQTGFQVLSDDRRFSGGITIVPRHRLGSMNTIVDLSYRIFKRDNQYLFLQFYNGYGEGLLEYNKFHSQIRVGLLIKPRLFSDF
ncbi:MAG: phospholipase A, partial [Muribaculaceae bacterium]|nr:phospholipase A [Muribaculaceae bacterium]